MFRILFVLVIVGAVLIFLFPSKEIYLSCRSETDDSNKLSLKVEIWNPWILWSKTDAVVFGETRDGAKFFINEAMLYSGREILDIRSGIYAGQISLLSGKIQLNIADWQFDGVCDVER